MKHGLLVVGRGRILLSNSPPSVTYQKRKKYVLSELLASYSSTTFNNQFHFYTTARFRDMERLKTKTLQTAAA